MARAVKAMIGLVECASLFLFPDRGGSLEPVHLRHLHVHQNQIETLFLPCRERLEPDSLIYWR
jgi:hypothetical protein